MIPFYVLQASALVTTQDKENSGNSGPQNLILERQNVSDCQETITTSTHVQEKIVRDYLPLFGIILTASTIFKFIFIQANS